MVYSNSDKLVSIASSEGNKKFKENVAFAERELFDILNFPLIQGDKNTILYRTQYCDESPNGSLKNISDDQNPINQVIRLDNKWDFRITGILKDLPVNTDRQDEIYLSYSNLKELQ